jgi:hypothetical protein
MIIDQERHCIIVKRDIKNVFRNILIVVQRRWLLKFWWKENYYKKRSLSFDFFFALFLFNLFVEAIYWMIVLYLCESNLRCYLDNFIEIFRSLDEFNLIVLNQLIIVLEVSIKSFKYLKNTIVLAFDIKIDINVFIARLFSNKMTRVIESIRLTLIVISINLLKIRIIVELNKTRRGCPNPTHRWGWTPYFVQWVDLSWWAFPTPKSNPQPRRPPPIWKKRGCEIIF